MVVVESMRRPLVWLWRLVGSVPLVLAIAILPGCVSSTARDAAARLANHLPTYRAASGLNLGYALRNDAPANESEKRAAEAAAWAAARAYWKERAASPEEIDDARRAWAELGAEAEGAAVELKEALK